MSVGVAVSVAVGGPISGLVDVFVMVGEEILVGVIVGVATVVRVTNKERIQGEGRIRTAVGACRTTSLNQRVWN